MEMRVFGLARPLFDAGYVLSLLNSCSLTAYQRVDVTIIAKKRFVSATVIMLDDQKPVPDVRLFRSVKMHFSITDSIDRSAWYD